VGLRLRDPRVEMVDISKVIQPGDEIGITNPEVSFPVTFHPKVVDNDQERIALDLPEKFWELVNIKKGMRVQITKLGKERMFYVEGEVVQINQGSSPNIIVQHPSEILCAQRRLFYRFDVRKNFTLSEIILPDGSSLESLKATLQDMSPGGIGFKTSVLLPRGSRFEVNDLFDPVIPAMENVDFFVEVVWCRGNRVLGYRCGAVFKFPSEREQDSFGRILSQLQINRLAWYYHNIHNIRKK